MESAPTDRVPLRNSTVRGVIPDTLKPTGDKRHLNVAKQGTV